MNRKIFPALLFAPLILACPADWLPGFGESDAEKKPDTSANGGGNGTDACAADQDPGRVTVHRMNRAEYNNTAS
jgi:hypothetical protein